MTLLTLAATLLLAAVPAQAAPGFVTLGFLPAFTDSDELTLRGTAPAGSVVTITINGVEQARVDANEISVYRYRATLALGWNQIVTQLDGSDLTAHKVVFRLSHSFGPDGAMSRAAFASELARAQGSDSDAGLAAGAGADQGPPVTRAEAFRLFRRAMEQR